MSASSATTTGTFLFSGRFRPTPDLLHQASRHLGNAALQYALVFAVAWVVVRGVALRYRILGFEAPAGEAPVPWLHMADGVVSATIVLSLLVFLLGRSGRLAVPRVFDLAVAYQVVAAFGVSTAEVWGPWAAGHTPRGVPWVCVWILVFPLVVPMPLVRSIVAAAASAATVPLALWLTVAVGQNPSPEPRVVLLLLAPALLLAALASFPARLVLPSVRAAEQSVGPYQLVEKLGEGGMGEVWRATHALLALPAAVKFIRTVPGGSPDTESANRRFEREARATALLTSPHTVTLYDYGITHDGAFYYVMELLDGVDLETLVKRHGPQDAARVVHLLRQAAVSLAEAHAHGMVHRDLKPANLIACHIGLDSDFVKVLDFGLVQLRDAPASDTERLTVAGHVAGTPMYMAPEAISGGQVGPWSDIYALGCVAWWLLVGEPVFPGRSAQAVLFAHLKESPGRLSSRVEEPIPEALERVVMQCLEKDPSKRPPDALALEAMLAAAVPEGGWTPERARRWWDLHEPGRQLDSGTVRPSPGALEAR